jgi:chloramphenicol 3-O phosphotransferase
MADTDTPPGEPRLPDVIFVNGPSSAGKTTICHALQAAIAEPYLCIGFDDFVFLSAPRYYRGGDTPSQSHTDRFIAEGVQMITTSRSGEPLTVVAKFGPVFRRLIDAMPAAVRALVDGGNAVVFDDVLHDREMYGTRKRVFAGLDVFAVGVTCDLDVLEARERARGDRVLGRARGLVNVVHSFCAYDVVVDTGTTDEDGCLAAILGALTARPLQVGIEAAFFRAPSDGFS